MVSGLSFFILSYFKLFFKTATSREKPIEPDQKYEAEGSEDHGIRGDQSGGHES
jgi:hypothetical protein